MASQFSHLAQSGWRHQSRSSWSLERNFTIFPLKFNRRNRLGIHRRPYREIWIHTWPRGCFWIRLGSPRSICSRRCDQQRAWLQRLRHNDEPTADSTFRRNHRSRQHRQVEQWSKCTASLHLQCEKRSFHRVRRRGLGLWKYWSVLLRLRCYFEVWKGNNVRGWEWREVSGPLGLALSFQRERPPKFCLWKSPFFNSLPHSPLPSVHCSKFLQKNLKQVRFSTNKLNILHNWKRHRVYFNIPGRSGTTPDSFIRCHLLQLLNESSPLPG